LSVAEIESVSFPPSLFSVNVTFEPATNFPFKKPAVVSFAETKVLTSVSAVICCQDEPL